jgi:hypothetical protein
LTGRPAGAHDARCGSADAPSAVVLAAGRPPAIVPGVSGHSRGSRICAAVAPVPCPRLQQQGVVCHAPYSMMSGTSVAVCCSARGMSPPPTTAPDASARSRDAECVLQQLRLPVRTCNTNMPSLLKSACLCLQLAAAWHVVCCAGPCSGSVFTHTGVSSWFL